MNPGSGKAFPSVCKFLAFSSLSPQQPSPLDLMSGSNSNMTLVTNVAEGLDGTDPSLSPHTWTCPDVDPYSTIYFYQFNAAPDKSNPAWTTRFTVRLSVKENRNQPLIQLCRSRLPLAKQRPLRTASNRTVITFPGESELRDLDHL